jgi:hypothetical protein
MVKTKKYRKQNYTYNYGRNYRGGNININNSSDPEVNKIMEKIDKQDEIPSINEIPIVGSVIEKTGDLAEGLLVKGIDTAGDLVGVDVDNPGSVGQKLDELKTSLSNPQNMEKAKEVAKEMGNYGSILVEASTPFVRKFVDETLPVVTDGAQKVVKSSINTGINVAEDFLGPIVGIPRTVHNIVETGEGLIQTGSDLVDGVTKAVRGTQENFNRLKNKAENATRIPTNINLPQTSNTFNNIRQIPFSQQGGAKEMKILKREAQQIGGRIIQSHLSFLAPHVTRSQILKKKSRAKNHTYKNKNKGHRR